MYHEVIVNVVPGPGFIARLDNLAQRQIPGAGWPSPGSYGLHAKVAFD
jgi:hypothetical protein